MITQPRKSYIKAHQIHRAFSPEYNLRETTTRNHSVHSKIHGVSANNLSPILASHKKFLQVLKLNCNNFSKIFTSV